MLLFFLFTHREENDAGSSRVWEVLHASGVFENMDVFIKRHKDVPVASPEACNTSHTLLLPASFSSLWVKRKNKSKRQKPRTYILYTYCFLSLDFSLDLLLILDNSSADKCRRECGVDGCV